MSTLRATNTEENLSCLNVSRWIVGILVRVSAVSSISIIEEQRYTIDVFLRSKIERLCIGIVLGESFLFTFQHQKWIRTICSARHSQSESNIYTRGNIS